MKYDLQSYTTGNNRINILSNLIDNIGDNEMHIHRNHKHPLLLILRRKLSGP